MRPGIRASAERALDRVGLLDRLLWLRARSGRHDLVVLGYHRPAGVAAAPDGGQAPPSSANGEPPETSRPRGGRSSGPRAVAPAIPPSELCAATAGELDPGLVDVSLDELAAQLDILRHSATVVSLADVRRFLAGRRAPPNAVMVSFDDGYAEVAGAVPILRRAGVPATFFIPTAFPDAGRLFWWDRVWLILRRTRCPSFQLGYPEPLTVHPRSSVPRAARRILDAAKRTEGLDLPRLWAELEAAAGVSVDPAEERALASRTLLGWSAIKKLRDAGMDVQSHAHEHVILNALPPEAAESDLRRSARALREVLGEAPFAVAYPVGYEVSGAHRAVARAAGFELGFTNGTGLCALDRVDSLNVPRVSMDLGLGPAGFKARLLVGDAQWAHARWPRPPEPRSPPSDPDRASTEAPSA